MSHANICQQSRRLTQQLIHRHCRHISTRGSTVILAAALTVVILTTLCLALYVSTEPIDVVTSDSTFLDIEGHERTQSITADVPASKSVNVVSGEGATKHRRRRRRIATRTDYETDPNWTSKLYYDVDSPPTTFRHWNESKKVICPQKLTVYDHTFAYLKDVVVDKSKFSSGRRGGELVGDVLNQDEQNEYYTVMSGAFKLPSCKAKRGYVFRGTSNHVADWYASLQDYDDDHVQYSSEFVGFTIAVTRYEYANLYHTMTDWYNAFLMMQFFGRTPAETNILIVDTHPYGVLDTVWPQLFNSTFRLSALGNRTRFRHLVWSIIGYESPMKIYVTADVPPLFEEFRTFFLVGYGMENGNRTRNCSSLSVRFIWRRDYVAHPRNPTGRVMRKIRNEAELIAHVRRSHPEFREVVGVQIDTMSMRDQLRFILDADVLVGVHGAGLAHAVFLQPGSALVEIAPSDIWSISQHFEAIADWRRLDYRRWTNTDIALNDDFAGWLTVRSRKVDAVIGNVARRMCSPHASRPANNRFRLDSDIMFSKSAFHNRIH